MSVPGPAPHPGWLRPEITGASQKIISICLGHSKVGLLAPPPAGNGPHPHRGSLAQRLGTSFPRSELTLVWRQHLPTRQGGV